MSKKIRAKEYLRTLHQKKWVQRSLDILFAVGLPGVGAYIRFVEPKLLKVSKIKIPLSTWPKMESPFRIVQISDLHYGATNNSTKFFKKAIQTINDLKPDIIALTGDFLQWDTHYLKSLANLLSYLKAPHIFAALGNHDYGVCHPGQPATDDIDYEKVIEEFQKKGIRVLHNERVEIKKGGNHLDIVGVGDFWTPHFLPEKAFANQNQNTPTLLLCHNPDSLEHLEQFHFDLMLSGHVHGGQISFPFIGPLTVPVKNRRWRRGLHRVGNKWLYANRGMGHIFKGRLLSRPEITCLELCSE